MLLSTHGYLNCIYCSFALQITQSFDIDLFAVIGRVDESPSEQNCIRYCNKYERKKRAHAKHGEFITSTDIASTATTHCMGIETCKHSTTLKSQSIHCYGYEACSRSTAIQAIEGDIVCSGITACTDIQGDTNGASSVSCMLYMPYIPSIKIYPSYRYPESQTKYDSYLTSAGVGVCEGVQGSLIAGDQMECWRQYSCADIVGVIQGFYVAASSIDAARDNNFVIRDKGYFSGSYSAHGSTIICEANIQYDGSYLCDKATMDAQYIWSGM